MLKKRVFILILTLFLFKLSAEDSLSSLNKELLDYSYTNSSQEFFIIGYITYNQINTPIAIYKTKNRDNLYDYSIKINEDLFKISSKEFEDFYNKNDIKVESTYVFESLPIEIFNYGLRNFDYSILEKAQFFKYKGLKTNKLLLTERKIIIPEPIIEEETKMDFPEIVSRELTSDELTSDELTSDELTSDELTSDELTSDELTSDELTSDELTSDSLPLDDNRVLDLPVLEKSDEEIPVIPQVKIIENKFIEGKYKKIIIYQVDNTNVITRKEFFSKINDTKPLFIIEATNIQFIKGFYTIIEYNILDVLYNKSYTIKFDSSSILLNKSEIPYEFSDLTNFYGVK